MTGPLKPGTPISPWRDRPGAESPPSSSLWDMIRSRKIVLLVGGGGVGKTTVSAAIALHAARQGKKVLAVTIDPARRLANSMGLKEIGNLETRVPLPASVGGQGELWVMMLDVKRSLDELITSYAPSTEIAGRILSNNIYRAVSDSLAGTEEFVALGKLYELQRQGRFDLIVVDTAPTRHALDFFESPARLMNLLDMRIIQWFLKPLDLVHRIGFKTFKRGTSFLVERVEKAIGLTFFTEIATFLQHFEGMFDKLSDKANRINLVLKDRNLTAIGLVTSAERGSISTAVFLARRLAQFGMPLNYIVVNRIHPLYRMTADETLLLRDFASTDAWHDELVKRILLAQPDRTGVDAEADYRYLKEVMRIGLPAVDNDLENLARLKKEISERQPIVTVPYFDRDVCDLEGLEQINRHLFPPG